MYGVTAGAASRRRASWPSAHPSGLHGSSSRSRIACSARSQPHCIRIHRAAGQSRHAAAPSRGPRRTATAALRSLLAARVITALLRADATSLARVTACRNSLSAAFAPAPARPRRSRSTRRSPPLLFFLYKGSGGGGGVRGFFAGAFLVFWI
ncbi:hypothetical protein Syun_016898 [Stephania yunnanensis]|uniref:Uncharacterized protein n=1 Tax=Stephania yunnanensis TaxID=152371 RepID=A0AAP0J882_9MAGN